MKQKLFALVLLLVACIAFTVACGGGDEPPNYNNLQTKYTTRKPVTTTAAGGGSDLPMTNVYELSSSSLRMLPFRVESADESIARCNVYSDGRGIQIIGVKEGATKITVYDDFDHELELEVTVNADKAVSCGIFAPFSEPNSRNVIFDCAAIANDSDENDDSPAIQKAIDELALTGGGTVYIPRGIYYLRTTLQLKDNIHLVLAGKVDDATVGYTDEVKKRVDGGEFAVLKAVAHDMFHNWKKGTRGVTGADNYSIKGGVLDMQGSSRCILFVCADNASVTDTIMKDCLNDHAIQVTGSTNITIRNVMFAGYNYKTGGNFSTGEEVQVEAAVEGATGISGMFGDGERYFCKNVVIDKCYFGKSDKYGSQTIAIGHHGYRESSDVDGYTISNCVFDNNRIYSIKTTSYSNVKILNNTFISDGDNRVKDKSDVVDTFILVTISNHDVTAKPLGEDRKPVTAYLAKSYSMQGTQNMQISGNSFTMNGAKAVRRVIVASSNSYEYGAQTVSNMMRFYGYGEIAHPYTGYLPVRNVIYNLVVTNNRVTVNCGESEYSDALMKFDKIFGLTFTNNTVSTELAFSSSYNSVKGVSATNCITGNDMYTRTIKMQRYTGFSDLGVLLPTSGTKTVKLLAVGSQKLVLKSDGHGSFDLTYDEDGDVNVVVNANNGYVFDGWTVESTGEAYAPTGDTASVSSSLTLVANFSRQ